MYCVVVADLINKLVCVWIQSVMNNISYCNLSFKLSHCRGFFFVFVWEKFITIKNRKKLYLSIRSNEKKYQQWMHNRPEQDRTNRIKFSVVNTNSYGIDQLKVDTLTWSEIQVKFKISFSTLQQNEECARESVIAYSQTT